MSHFSLVKVKIKNPNAQLLKRAVELIAKELGGQVTEEVRDYYGNAMNVVAGIVNNVFPRGVGVKVNERGEVEIVGDFWGVPKAEVQKFQQLLTQYYTAMAVQQALSALGYRVEVQEQKQRERIFIRGVAL